MYPRSATGNSHAAVVFLVCLASLAVALLALSALLFCACPKSFAAAPQVQVIVMCTEGQPDDMTIAYSEAISEGQARADFEAVLRLGGWEAEERPRYRGRSERSPTTTISGRVRGMVDRMSGKLPVEPFVLALRRHRRLSVTFLVGDPFYYKGITEPVENNYLRIEPLAVSTRGSYTFDIFIKDIHISNAEQLPSLSRDAGRSERALSWGVAPSVLLVTAVALGLALATYAGLRRTLGRHVMPAR